MSNRERDIIKLLIYEYVCGSMRERKRVCVCCMVGCKRMEHKVSHAYSAKVEVTFTSI